MIETVENFIKLILDKSKHWTYKIAILISIISTLFILDFTFKISYNHFLSNKLQNLEKIQILKKSYTNEPKKLSNLKKIENSIFYEKHYSEYIETIDLLVAKTPIEKKNITKPIPRKPEIRSYSWMLVSSSLVFIIIIIVLFTMLFKKGQTFKTILNWFSTLIVFTLLSVFSTWIAFKIPLIFGIPTLNYILNFILHCGFIYLITKLNDKLTSANRN
ncbi:hypothetical protein [Flavobacterium sp. ZB4P13]|uniref:hypothetical protein n=1 Tax=Flavobacterium sp. ZB4P13 TaxID=3401728 RepID=UPI003AAEBB5F